ncbi:unnamed protein product, partial [Rotaria sp. Silwood1]
PILFKSYEEYDSATAAPSNAPAEATTITTMSNTLATTKLDQEEENRRKQEIEIAPEMEDNDLDDTIEQEDSTEVS